LKEVKFYNAIVKISTDVYFCLTAIFVLQSLCAFSQDKNLVPVEGETVSHIFRPRREPVTAERVKGLTVPTGFEVSVFADGMGNPRIMRVTDEGKVYVTDRNNGRLMLLQDTDKDGKADSSKVLLEMEHIHGIDFYDRKLYVATIKEIYKANIKADGSLGFMKPIITDLPDAGQHHNRTVRFSRDSMMYISVGSTCNSCEETNKEAASMLVARPDGTGRRVYAKGLRNTIGFDWHPLTNELWGWDNGMDHLGDDEGKEELNHLIDNGNYGWPFIYEKKKYDRHHDPPTMTHKAYAEKCVDPTLLFDAHGASMEFIFYTGKQFPSKYKNGGFVAMRGSWNRQNPAGYRVLFVQFDDKGNAVKTEDFFHGFLVDNNKGEFGRPVGLAQYVDGSLLVSDDVNGVIYRISWSK
jgi:glucose/arabinose dehydrogenase